jgi:WD40 repeat protein
MGTRRECGIRRKFRVLIVESLTYPWCRLASSPLKTLEGHQKGVLSVAWCKNDSDLLLSCGKDNRILVWNPNSPQVSTLELNRIEYHLFILQL